MNKKQFIASCSHDRLAEPKLRTPQNADPEEKNSSAVKYSNANGGTYVVLQDKLVDVEERTYQSGRRMEMIFCRVLSTLQVRNTPQAGSNIRTRVSVATTAKKATT